MKSKNTILVVLGLAVSLVAGAAENSVIPKPTPTPSQIEPQLELTLNAPSGLTVEDTTPQEPTLEAPPKVKNPAPKKKTTPAPSQQKAKKPKTAKKKPTFEGFQIQRILPPREEFTEIQAPQKDETDEVEKLDGHHLDICSFNIQFLGNDEPRDHAALADFLRVSQCDMVVVQELLAPPDLGLVPNGPITPTATIFAFPDDTPLKYNPLVTRFFLEMRKSGFDRFWLSEEDTGRGHQNHINSSATEWFLVFYKNWLVRPKLSLPHGFLSEKRTANPMYDRVPYAFAFETRDKRFDFVLINTHLRPDGEDNEAARRREEFSYIFDWIDEQKKMSSERDYIILGDTNINDGPELANVLSLRPALVSLNINAKTYTNTNINIMKAKPYDHVIFDAEHTTEIDVIDNFDVLNLLEGMRPYWLARNPNLNPDDYPGHDYKYRDPGVRETRPDGRPGKYIVKNGHDIFREIYSDHHPIKFRAVMPAIDDDGGDEVGSYARTVPANEKPMAPQPLNSTVAPQSK